MAEAARRRRHGRWRDGRRRHRRRRDGGTAEPQQARRVRSAADLGDGPRHVRGRRQPHARLDREEQRPRTTNSNYWYDDLWMSTNTTLGSGGTDVFLGSVQHTNPLAAGDSYSASGTFTVPRTRLPGTTTSSS